MSELTKNVKPLDDFNWEEFENGTSVNVSKEELDRAYNETLNKVSEHQVTEGTVISCDKKEVIVNIGYKSDGIIPASEFRYNPDLKVGDKVEVYVENQEDKKGQLILSHKKALVLQTIWEIPDLSDHAAIKKAKAAHNAAQIRLAKQFRSEGCPGFLVGASGCALCSPCAKAQGEPCRFPDYQYSCMSAYCIFVRKLADKCEMEYNLPEGLLAFFGMYVFD